MPPSEKTHFADVSHSRARILLAEYNADMREHIGRLLTERYQVTTVGDGQSAYAAACEELPDLIMADVLLPGLAGIQLLQKLRTDLRTRELTVILLSDQDGEDARVQGIEAGADDYLTKPFSAKELLARIESHLELTKLRREAAALRASEERLRSIFEQTAAGIAQVDLQGRFIFVNQRFCEMTGYTLDELRGTTFEILTHPDDASRNHAMFQTALNDRRPYSIEKRYVRKDGSDLWVRNSVSELTDRNGKPEHMLAVSLDITERKLAEALRSEQRQAMEMIATGQPLADILITICRIIEDQEPGLLCSILLFDEPGRRTGKAFGSKLSPEFILKLEDIDIGQPHVGSCCYALDCNEEVVVTDIESDQRWSPAWRDLNLTYNLRSCRSIPICGSDGAVLASVAVFRNRTGDPGPANEELLRIATHLIGIAIERTRSVQATHQRSEQLRQLANVATQLNTALDVSSITGIANEEARRLIGAHQAVTSFTIDLNWGQAINVVSLSDKYAAWRGFEQSPNGSGIYSQVCRTNKPMRFTQAELEAHPAFLRFGQHSAAHPPMRGWLAAPLVGRNGRNLGLIQLSDKYSGDFTQEDEAILVQLSQMASVAIENARLVQDLRDADRRKDEFLATLAHELRNPLAPLRNGLQIFRLGGGTGEIADQALSMMERQLGQMVHLIDDLLDLSRISRGKIELRKQRVELAKVVQQAIETSRPAVEEAGHTLTMDIPAGPILIDADITRLAQVFSNLLNNAAKYTLEGGQVHLTVQAQGLEAMVSVRDTGIGIPAQMLPRVFEMFTQVDRNLARSQGGLGIGLSIVKRLVEMHGGLVEARSEGEGLGSEFVVRLPLLHTAVQPQQPPDDLLASAGSRRVLVVDDNRDAAITLAMMLKLMGNETQLAHDGLEAIEVATAYRPDFIFLDIGMPKMNGYEAARHIRQQPWGKSIVLVALTGWGQEDDRRRSQEAGFDAHLTKPIEPSALPKLLTSLKSTPG